MSDHKGSCFYRCLTTRTWEHKTIPQNFAPASQIQWHYHNQWWFFFSVHTSMKTVWKVRPTEWLKRDVFLFYCVLQCSSKCQLFPKHHESTAHLWRATISHSNPTTQLLLLSKTAEKRGLLCLWLRVAPCKSHCVPERPPVLRPPMEQAALGLQWKALLENLQSILTSSAFDLTFRTKTFERILKVTFKGCSNLSS